MISRAWRDEDREEVGGWRFGFFVVLFFWLMQALTYPLRAQTNPTNCYVNQMGVLVGVEDPASAGKIRGMGAHGTAIVGEDGIQYGMYDECLPAAARSPYQKPQASAGPKAIGWWQFYNGPQNQANRCRSLLIGSRASDPPAPDPCNTGGSASICLWAQPPSGTFHPAIVPCGGTPPTPTPVPTPAPNIYAAWCEAAYNQGYMSPCGTNLFCPGDSAQIINGLVTRAQEAVFLLKAVHGVAYAPPHCVGLFTDTRCAP